MRSAALLLAVAGLATAHAAPIIVQTKSGPVAGTMDGTSKAWRGIPFAADTGGANRFLPPKPRPSWTEPLDCSAFGPGCYQTHHNADVPKNISEDCLNLNVYTPADANATSKLPVMVYWHGGSFAEGSDQGPFFLYDGGYIAGHKEVIVVTANYRLGALGWLVTDTLMGNQGLLDQRASLEWVHANIAAFGGDATRITIWGESAGAMSVGLHLVMSGSKGLFSNAIMESNPAGYRYRTPSEAGMYGANFCTQLNCSSGGKCDLACIQNASAADVGRAWNKAGDDWEAIVFANWGHWLDAILDWVPTIDGTLVPMNPQHAIDSGSFDTNVHLLVGSNHNEGTTFIYAALKNALPTFLFELAEWGIFGTTYVKEIEAMYKNITPSSSWADGRDMFSRIITDYWFACATERFAQAASAKGTPAYVYRYDHVLSFSSIFGKFGIPPVCETRVCHGSELPMVFHNTVPSLNASFDAAELVLADSFLDYWTSFVINGDPNVGNNQPTTWPKFDSATRNHVVLDTPSVKVASSYDLCSAWDGIGYQHVDFQGLAKALARIAAQQARMEQSQQ